MKTYRPSNTAAREVEHLYEYGARRFGLNTADAYFDAMHDTFGRLAEYPKIGRIHEPLGRVRRFSHWPYVIIYRETPDGILILRIVHGKSRDSFSEK